MKMTNLIRTTTVAAAVAVLTLLSWSARPAAAEFYPDNRASLKGLAGVHVLVERIPADMEAAGLTEELVRSEVEGRLKKAGLKLLSRKDFIGQPGAPRLYIQLNSAKYKGRFLWSSEKIAFSIRLDLGQLVKLSRNPEIEVHATTWQTSLVGYADDKKLQTVRDDLAAMVDRFIKAWQEAGQL